MAEQELRGKTLGEKHQDYNEKLREYIANQKLVTDIKIDDSDINNLLKIDVASHNKDVDFILNVLKCDDMLYVSRALSSSIWLVTDQQYANIINYDYLQSELYPHMITKAIIKLKKCIRHNIRDESRAEKFYFNEKDKIEAIKWLPHCSVTFMENEIENNFKLKRNIPIKRRLFKRLCERSVSVFEIIVKHSAHYERLQYLQDATFLLKINVDKYLDVLENDEYSFRYPKLNHKATQIIMKHDSNRIKDKIEKYISAIHLPTFVKYFKIDEIKPFLYAQAKKDIQNPKFSKLKKLFDCDTLKHFITKLPEPEQFEFVKAVCMSRENQDSESDPDAALMRKICGMFNHKSYVWYQFAAFEHAFEEITKLISQNVNANEKHTTLYFLIKCADLNLGHIDTILKYFIQKHKNEESSFKLQFVTEILKHANVSKYNAMTWNTLNELLTSMTIYETPSELSLNNTEIVNFIIIYSAINDKSVPDMIKKLFVFDTLKSCKSNMNQEQQNKIFNFLYEYLLSEIKNPETEKGFKESIKTHENVLKLLQDWGKSLQDHPLILSKIRELIKLKKEKSFKESLASLYNIDKSWRKYMFEESVALCPSEEVYFNALKHDPELLTRYSDEIDSLRADDAVSLRQFLSKLRVYWPHSLAQQWTAAYLHDVNETNAKMAIVRGLCTILPQKSLLDMIEKYKPENPKIDWKLTDERVLNIQRFLAKNMHIGRPQPTPDAILPYAKGDYLQFALPSLFAVFYNLKTPMTHQYIPKLLDAPVSLQKHGIRFAFKKLDGEELKEIFLTCWKTSKNVSIRAIIFKYTFALLCDEKDTVNAMGLWELLELFIDNLTFTEDKNIYQLLGEVDKIPLSVRSKFLVKSYNFLQKLIPNIVENERSHYEWLSGLLAEHTREVMETINTQFVVTIIQDYIDNDFFKEGDKFVRTVHHSNGILRVITAYLLCSTNENDQIEKYNNIFVPLMQRSFEKWSEIRDGNFLFKNQFQEILTCLTHDLKEYVIKKKMILPLKMFTLIQGELEKSLPITENYLTITKWNLTVALTTLAEQYYSAEKEWDELFCFEFGSICLEYLKKDIMSQFPCIYVLFSKSVKDIVHEILPENAKLKFYSAMLSDKDFIYGYLSSIEIGSDYRRNKEYDQLWKQVFSHPSAEVKMHYYGIFEEKSI